MHEIKLGIKMKIDPKYNAQKCIFTTKKKSFQSFFFLVSFKSIKVLELQNYIHIAALLFNHVLTWSSLVEIFSFIEKKKNCISIVQPSVVRGLPTIDQIFSFIKSEQIIKDLQAKEVNQPEYGHVLQDFLVLFPMLSV